MALNQPTLVSRLKPYASVSARWRRAWTGAAMAVLGAIALAACGGGGDGEGDSVSAAVQVDTSRTAKATIGSAGGNVSATAADGRRYTLMVPAGALSGDTEITATPVTSMGNAPLAAGVKAAVRFGPSGLRFGQAATLRIEGAATTVTSGKRRVGYVRSDDGAALEFSPVELAGNALELRVSHFSDAVVTDASREEVNAISPASITDPVDRLADAFDREIAKTGDTSAEVVATLVRLHDQMVAPVLQTAESLADDATKDAFRESAIATWRLWQRFVEISDEDASKFGGLVERARARAGAILLNQVDRGHTDCLDPSPVDFLQFRGLHRALGAQVVAQVLDLDAADLGLDAATVARRMNDCARVVFVPRPLPTFEVGRAVSLDQEAELVFAADPNLEAPADFAFVVASADATIANPEGLSNNIRQYTTVVTPRVADPLFDVRACLVTFMANRAPVPSVMCGNQTVGGSTGIVLSGELRFSAASEQNTTSSQIRLRIRAELDGSFTVLEATGQESARSTSVLECFNEVLGRFVSVPRVNTIDSTITSGRTVPNPTTGLPGAFFELLGQRVERLTVFTVGARDCSTELRTEVRESVRTISPSRIERDARGPTAMVFGDAGRLVRE